MKHPSGIEQAIVDKVVARRGSLHRYPSLDPKNTVLVVIDLDEKSVEMDPRLVGITGPINRVAQKLRAAGGRVAWVTTPISVDNIRFYRDLLGDGPVRDLVDCEDLDLIEQHGVSHEEPLPLHPFLAVQLGDIQSVKHHYSAFAIDCDLLAQLYGRRIDDWEPTLLFAGTVTNVCVESSVRDAVELGLKAIVLSDVVVGHSHGLHEASLATIFRNFGDVRPSAEVIALLSTP